MLTVILMWKQLTVEDGGTLKLRWFTGMTIVQGLIAVAWIGFAIKSFVVPGVYGDDVFLLFPLVMGVFVALYTVRDVVNTTTIAVDADMLTVRHAPLPAWRDRDISVHAIAGVMMRERGMSGRYPATYDVVALTKDGREVRLVRTYLVPARELTIALQRRLTRA